MKLFENICMKKKSHMPYRSPVVTGSSHVPETACPVELHVTQPCLPISGVYWGLKLSKLRLCNLPWFGESSLRGKSLTGEKSL